MLTEIKTDRAERMEAHRQALIEAALEHERVIAFLAKLNEILTGLGREDIEIKVETYLKNNGVAVAVSVIYDSLYPGQARTDPQKNARMEQAEATLLDALRHEDITVKSSLVEGVGHIMRSHLFLLKARVDYQGNFSEEEEKIPKSLREFFNTALDDLS